MFLKFYQLREQPFGVTPDPKYLFATSTHREALASLLYGIKSGRGFMSLVAPPGSGKTTLLFWLLGHLAPKARTAFIFQTQCDPNELRRQLLADLGVAANPTDPVTVHQELNKFLIQEAQEGHEVVVVIDEAQNLSDEVLESVRLLSNFETPRGKLLQVILAGQPALAQKLASPGLSQLCQRLAVMTHLRPLNPEEVTAYINHRLQVAGQIGGRLFDAEAYALIAALSGGIPRKINNLCFTALSLGCAEQKKVINSAIIREAMGDLNVLNPGTKLDWPGDSDERPSAAYQAPPPPARPRRQTPRPRPAAAPMEFRADGPPVEFRLDPPAQVERARRPVWALASAAACVLLATVLFLSRTLRPNMPVLSIPTTSAAAAPEPDPATTSRDVQERHPAGGSGTALPLQPQRAKIQPAPLKPRVERKVEAKNRVATGGKRETPNPAEALTMLRIVTRPAGATVNIDGQSYGKSPAQALLPTGPHTYRLDLNGFAPLEKSIYLDKDNDTTMVEWDFRGYDAGKTAIETTPPGADIFIDGTPRGSSPRIVQLTAGKHRLVMSLSGYKTISQEITVPANQTISVSSTLSALVPAQTGAQSVKQEETSTIRQKTRED